MTTKPIITAKTSLCLRGHDKNVVGRVGYNCKACLQSPERKAYKNLWLRKKNRRSPLGYGWKKAGILNDSGTFFTPLDYDRLYQIQGGKCRICQVHQSEVFTRLAVDHNHTTGKARGLLCQPCNARLGVIEDSAYVSKANLYLQDYL